MEIKELKTRLREPSVNSSIPSLPKDEKETTSHVGALQKIISDRDKQLADVKTQLQVATKEMEQSTQLIKSLKEQKESNKQKIETLEVTVKELKKQLSSVHERCQNLQTEVSFNEKTIREKDIEVIIITIY